MKYGKIKNGTIIYYFRTDNGEWAGGNCQCLFKNCRDEKDGLYTAAEAISLLSLKPITATADFNGNYGDYNFAETETEIKLLDMTDTAKKEANKKQIEAEIISLKKQLAETDYITIKYSEAKSGARPFNNGEEEKCLDVIAERETTREKIRLLELQL